MLVCFKPWTSSQDARGMVAKSCFFQPEYWVVSPHYPNISSQKLIPIFHGESHAYQPSLVLKWFQPGSKNAADKALVVNDPMKFEAAQGLTDPGCTSVARE